MIGDTLICNLNVVKFVISLTVSVGTKFGAQAQMYGILVQ